METKTYTQEEVKQIVEIVYHSVNAINKLSNQEILSDSDIESLTRNKDYIKIYLNKDWFVTALTVEQKAELEAIVK